MNQQMDIYKYAFLVYRASKTVFIAHTWNTYSLEDYTESASVAWCSYVPDCAWLKL
jgi:hypothetical protein